ncbi:MAG: hypothetical protein OHK0011_19490 [Turneriella sp.]
MEVRVETIEDLKRIRFSEFDKVFCRTKEKEYYLKNDAGLSPDDEDIIQAAHGSTFRWVAQKARNSGGGGGGGGSSPYPDTVTIVNSSRTLTPSDQGIVQVWTTGLTVTLPANPALGETYKIVAPFGVTINPNGRMVYGGINRNTPFVPGRTYFEMVAIDFGGVISWGVKQFGEFFPYSASKVYGVGDAVRSGTKLYFSIADNNEGNPLTDATKWCAAGEPATITATGTISSMSIV